MLYVCTLAQVFHECAADQSKKMTLHDTKPRHIKTGGFLAVGKTNAVGKLARRLSGQGARDGLMPITWDFRQHETQA